MKPNLKMKSHRPVLTDLRSRHGFLRMVVRLLIITFCTMVYNPSVYAIVNSKADSVAKMREQSGLGDSIQSRLEQLQAGVERLNRLIGSAEKSLDVAPLSRIDTVLTLVQDDPVRDARLEVQKLWQQTEAAWQKRQEQHQHIVAKLQAKKLPKAIANLEIRHQVTVDKFATVAKQMGRIAQADSQPALRHAAYQVLKQLSAYLPALPAHIYNAGEMPFGVSSDATRSPYTTEAGLYLYLGLPWDPTLNHAQASVNTAVDTAANIDVQITADVSALAAELNHDPVAIYNWVYNNVHYIPSFGSIQGSAQTLANRQGNAFDTASLLIALLRASNIPARYVYGTVVLPAEQINNWIGGVRDIESGRVVMAQGGIPTSAISYGGRFERLRMEHVWVEAYGNFNEQGAQRWNGMDAAFKQYIYTDGMDLLNAVGFDASEMRTLVENSGTQNQAEGWVSNVDSTQVQNRLTQYQTALQTYLENQHPDATLGEVIGGQRVIQRTDSTIPAQLPYLESIRTRSFAQLPDQLRHYFRVELARNGGNLLTFQQSLPDLAGKQLALSFRPATETDEAIVAGLFDGVQAIEDLPTELEAGLFNVVAEVTVNGEVIETSPAVGFGDLLSTDKGFIDPRFGYRTTTSPITAGDYQAIGLDLQGITVKQAQDLKSQLETVQTRLSQQQFNALTKHDVVGGLLQGGLLSYFGMNDAINKLAARMKKLVHYRMPSFGTFSTHSQADTIFGSSSTVTLGAVAMDIDWLMANNEGKANCWQDWVAFNQMSGQIASAYEHIIPEQIFSTDQNRVEAVSTVKALAVANAEGQKIYTITQSNINHTLPLITANNLVKQDIQQAVAEGNTATIHERPIDYEGYQGSGYILLDPDTGTGAYKITGGGNGSIAGQLFFLGFIISLISINIGILAVAAISGGLIAAIFAITALTAVSLVLGEFIGLSMDLYSESSLGKRCFWRGIILGLNYLGLLSLLAEFPIGLAFALEIIGILPDTLDDLSLPSMQTCIRGTESND